MRQRGLQRAEQGLHPVHGKAEIALHGAVTEREPVGDLRHREVVVVAQHHAHPLLRYYDDLTVPEIADRLSLAEGTVKRYLSLAVHRMEALLGPLAPATVQEPVLISVLDPEEET